MVNVATCIVTPKLCVPTTGFGCNGYVLPTGDGQADGVMCTDGSGGLSFASPPYKTSTTYTADQTFQDNIKLTLGTGGDADLYYDGTNVILLPAVVGSGKVGIGTATPSHFVDIEGVAHAATCFVSADLCATTKVVSAALCVGSQYALPAADGSAGQLMCTDGSGAIAFATVASTSPGGSDTQIQFNNSGAFGASSNLTWDDTTLAIGNSSAADYLALRLYQGGGTTYYWDFTADVDAGDLIIGGNHSSFDLILNPSYGNVGIGTAAPGSLLHAEGSTGYMKFIPTVGGNTCLALTSNSGATEFGTYNGSHLLFYTDSSERMRIDTSGRVGIGTGTMAQKLDVRQDSSGLPVVTICNAATCGRGFSIDAGCGNASNYIMSVKNNPGTALLQFTGDGKLGIGTAAPATTLDVYGAATFQNTVCVGATTCDAGIVFCLGRGRIFGCCETHVCSRLILQTCGDGSFSTIQTYHLRGSCVNGCICTGYCLCAGTCIGSPTKNFEIEHPLASDESPNKYNMMHLVHSTLEGPEYGVYYRGSAQLDSGAVKVDLPEYFEALAEKTDATVQLTSVGGISNLTIKLDEESIFTNNSFCVCTDDAGSQTQCFHWIVNGRRIDKHILCAIAQGDRPGAYDDGRLCTTRWEYRGEMENINGLETMTCAELDDFIDFNNTWDNDDPDFVTGYENVSKANKIIMIGNAFDTIQNSAEGGKTDFSDEEEE